MVRPIDFLGVRSFVGLAIDIFSGRNFPMDVVPQPWLALRPMPGFRNE